MKKPSEIEFMRFVLAHDGKVPSEFWEGLTKPQYGYLDKWSNQGFWDYGVSARSGWITEEGCKAFTEWTRKEDSK